jgi:hypothetical protein
LLLRLLWTVAEVIMAGGLFWLARPSSVAPDPIGPPQRTQKDLV